MLFEKEKRKKKKIINMINDFQVVNSTFNRNVT